MLHRCFHALTLSFGPRLISHDFVAACVVYARTHAQGTRCHKPNSLGSDYTSDTTSHLPPNTVSNHEANFYYAGISPSPPKLVYRTGSSRTPWVKPRGLEAYRKLKRARGVFGHRINLVWDKLGPLVRDLLNKQKTEWTSIDVVRFLADGERHKKILGPVIIWVGVRPDSLPASDAFISSVEILELLASFEINDVEVEYRESIYKRSGGTALLRSVSNFNNTVDVRGPLTPALGLPIAASGSPNSEGTMGLYFSEGGDSNKVLGLTCHHVLFTEAGAPPKHTQLLGTRAFDKLLGTIKNRIGLQAIKVGVYENHIKYLEDRECVDEEDSGEEKEDLSKIRTLLDETNEAIEDLEKFYERVRKEWDQPAKRIIGHISSRSATALKPGTDGFTEDWTAFELHSSMFKDAFRGNFIDLGTEISATQFRQKMYSRDDDKPTFKYPRDRLLALREIITEELMREPNMLDDNKEPSMLVIKSGSATGVTIGRASGCLSFVRDHETGTESKAWAIYNYDSRSGAFSAPGDSGSIIVDGLGRIGGLLTGRSGETGTSDVTYATPMWWLWSRIKEHFPDADLYPTAMG